MSNILYMCTDVYQICFCSTSVQCSLYHCFVQLGSKLNTKIALDHHPPPPNHHQPPGTIRPVPDIVEDQDLVCRSTKGPGPKDQDLRTRTKGPGPKDQNQRTRTKGPGPKDQDRRTRTKGLGPKDKDQRNRTKGPGPKD